MATSKKKRGSNAARYNQFDIILIVVVFFLIGFGLLMIYSTSSYEAGVDYGDPAKFLVQQLKATAIGLVLMFVVSMIPYEKFKHFDLIAYLVAIVSVLLLFSPLAVSRNGATRWIKIPFIGFTVQSAEICKVSIILFCASYIVSCKSLLKTAHGFLKFYGGYFAAAAILGVGIWKVSNNLSSAIIILGIAVCMLFVAVPEYKPFLIVAGVVIVMGVGFILVSVMGGEGTSFRSTRVRAWLHPEEYSSDTAFQTLQSLYAIGSGGTWGKGLGQSMQKRGFLPESQNDMIFSIICEELGLFGALVVIVLFIALIWSCMMLANTAKDQFGALLIVGVMSHLAIQVILNVAVVTNLIPNTGISLPFISCGGSAVLFLLVEIGMVLSVSKGSKVSQK